MKKRWKLKIIKKMKKTSSRASELKVKNIFSKESKAADMNAVHSFLEISFTKRYNARIDRTPKTTLKIRHPSGLSPNRVIPVAMRT